VAAVRCHAYIRVVMTTMLAEAYDALLAAGSPEDKARKAAEAIAGYDNRFTAIDTRLGAMDNRFTKIEADLNLVKWMLGFVLAFCVAIVFLPFNISTHLTR
jgi:hypothetical protein